MAGFSPAPKLNKTLRKYRMHFALGVLQYINMSFTRAFLPQFPVVSCIALPVKCCFAYLTVLSSIYTNSLSFTALQHLRYNTPYQLNHTYSRSRKPAYLLENFLVPPRLCLHYQVSALNRQEQRLGLLISYSIRRRPVALTPNGLHTTARCATVSYR